MLTGNLEYLISSLPNLSLTNSETSQHEVKALFHKYSAQLESSKNLVSLLNEEASKFLSSSNLEKFQKIQLRNIHKSDFQNSKIEVVSQFSKFIHFLKTELKTLRMTRKSGEIQSKLNSDLLHELPNNPLDTEEYLIKIQWQKLEALSIGHYSNLSALIIYKLKLELLSRWWQFDAKAGFDVFQKSLKIA